MARLCWAAGTFLSDALESNKRFMQIDTPDITWLYYALLTYGTVLFCAMVLSAKKKSFNALVIVEILLIPLMFYSVLIPNKAFRFFMGVQNFNFVMSIHSEAFNWLYYLRKPKKGNEMINKPFSENLRTILGMGIPNRVENYGLFFRRFPTKKVIIHFFVISTTADVTTYLIREWIPYHVSPHNEKWAVSLVGALWLLCALEFFYWFITVICAAVGSPLNPEMNHKNPLLSTSLAEFWGIRWNPVIGKQLQDSVYKPLRKVGADRSSAVIACFTGSALLHALPKLLSEKSLEECLMMFGFFFVQGFCLVLEAIMQSFTYRMIRAKPPKNNKDDNKEDTTDDQKKDQKKEDKKDNKKNNKKDIVDSPTKPANKSPKIPTEELLISYEKELEQTRDNFIIELAIMNIFITGFYLVFEIHFQNIYLLMLNLYLIVYVFSYIVDIQTKLFDRSNRGNQNVKVSRNLMIILIVMGWLWTVSCFISQLPLFIMPMMTVVSDFYSQSFAIGPLVRTVEKFIAVYN